jgi:hypothetical protein
MYNYMKGNKNIKEKKNYVPRSSCPHLQVSRIPQTENGTNEKRQLPFVSCKQKIVTANFGLFAASKNGKHTFFLSQQMVTGNNVCCFSNPAHLCH